MCVCLRGARERRHRASVAGLEVLGVQAPQRREGGAGLLERAVALAGAVRGAALAGGPAGGPAGGALRQLRRGRVVDHRRGEPRAGGGVGCVQKQAQTHVQVALRALHRAPL